MNEMQDAIVVGIDGSEESRHAMAWAFDEAGSTQSRVHLLHVASDYAYKEVIDTLMRDEFAAAAVAIVEQAQAASPEGLPVPVTAGWTWGAPARVLVDASTEARMVVVGTRGRGGFATATLGSVSQHVARHARCPVTVARPADAAGTRVIVGLDPATPDPALRVAFEEAAGRGLSLTVVRAWHVPPFAGPGLGVPAAGYDVDDVERAAHASAEEPVLEWTEKFPDVTVDIQLSRGNAAHVLVEASRRADLAVVGSHGRGWFTGMLLGSTSAAVAAHAHCPVLIAR